MNLISLLATANASRSFVDELSGVTRLDDARFGSFGLNELADYYSKFQEMVAGHDPRVEEINSIELGNSRVEEVELHLHKQERTIRLPLAVVYDQTGQGRQLRSYYANYPIDQTHRDRPAILSASHDLTLPARLRLIKGRFADGDLEATLAMLEPTATVREPSGGTFGPARGQNWTQGLLQIPILFRGRYSLGTLQRNRQRQISSTTS